MEQILQQMRQEKLRFLLISLNQSSSQSLQFFENLHYLFNSFYDNNDDNDENDEIMRIIIIIILLLTSSLLHGANAKMTMKLR